jgi:hypothetical protein
MGTGIVVERHMSTDSTESPEVIPITRRLLAYRASRCLLLRGTVEPMWASSPCAHLHIMGRI